VKTDIFLRKKSGHIAGLSSKDGQSFKPADLAGAGVGQVNYVVRKLAVDKSPKNAIVIDTVFLEVMSREKISLLFFVDEYDKSHYYIEDENGIATELGLKILDTGDGITFQELPTYKGTLKALFPSCSSLFPEIDKTKYTAGSIRAIFTKLYACKYGAAPKINVSNQSVTDFGITAGVSSAKIKFVGNGLAPYLSFNSSTAVTGGIFAETRFARANMFSLRNEVTYRSYDATSKAYQTSLSQVVGHVKASYLKYNLSGRIEVTRSRVKPFISLGVIAAYLLSSQDKATVTTGTKQREDDLIDNVKSYEIGFFGGVGVSTPKFSAEIRLEDTGGLVPSEASKVATGYVLLSYKLKKR
jgi:hypothetical protein